MSLCYYWTSPSQKVRLELCKPKNSNTNVLVVSVVVVLIVVEGGVGGGGGDGGVGGDVLKLASEA